MPTFKGKHFKYSFKHQPIKGHVKTYAVHTLYAHYPLRQNCYTVYYTELFVQLIPACFSKLVMINPLVLFFAY